MNLKQLLRVVIFLVLVIFAVFSFAIYSFLQNYESSLKKIILAEDIVRDVFERRVLADEYLAIPSARSKLQWFAKQEKLRKILRENEGIFLIEKEKEQIKQMEEGIEESEQVFAQVVELLEKNEASSSALVENRTRLIGQLSLKAQETISAAANLEKINETELEKNFQQIIVLFSSAASLFFVMLVVSFWVIWKSASRLETKEKELAEAQAAGGVGSFIANLKTGQVTLSAEMYKIYGITPQDGNTTINDYLSLIHPEDRPKIEKILGEMTSPADARKIEYRVIHPDGSIKMLQANGQVSVSGEGLVLSGTVRDITREKELEQLKDDFVSLASHELRTPMGAIRSLVDTLLKGDYGKIPEEIKDPLSDIQISTERLIRLVNDMLNISRIEAGRLKIEPSEFSLNKLISEVIKSVKPAADQQNLDLKVEVEDVLVSGDSDKVAQIFNNLIGNSLKFTTKGYIAIMTKADKEIVKIYVADTGMGISKEDQKKLFGKFQQISSAQLGKPAGSGLGLYFSKSLAKKMGGDLWLESSDAGKGSIFAFSLPLANTALAKQVKISLNEETKVHTDQKEMTTI